MPVVFITGASRGIGLALVEEYSKQGWTVIASCRSPKQAAQLNALAKSRDIEIVELDVSDRAQVDMVARQLEVAQQNRTGQ